MGIKTDFDSEVKQEIINLAKTLFNMKDNGTTLTSGHCPDCHQNELFLNKERPYQIACSRGTCGFKGVVRTMPEFSHVFHYNIEARFKNDPDPLAASKALMKRRGFLPSITDGEYTQEVIPSGDLRGQLALKFKLENGSYFYKAIDKVQGKRDSQFKGVYKGSHWIGVNQAPIKDGDTVTFTEAIFKTTAIGHIIGLDGAPYKSISAMSSNNFPWDFIKENTGRKLKFIVAYDNDDAGISKTLKYIKEFKNKYPKEFITAAITANGDGDWDQVLLSGKLNYKYIDQSLLRGKLLLAKDHKEYAFWLFAGSVGNSPQHVFEFRDYHIWSSAVTEKRLGQFYTDMADLGKEKDIDWRDSISEAWLLGADQQLVNQFAYLFYKHVTFADVCNRHISIDYSLKDSITKEISYLVRSQASKKKIKYHEFDSTMLKNPANFRGKLLGSETAALYTAGVQTFDINCKFWFNSKITEVRQVQFVGYDRELDMWVFPEFGFADGKYIKADENGIIRHGDIFVKCGLTCFEFQTNPDFDSSFFDDFYGATSYMGVVALAWCLLNLFFQQIVLDSSMRGYPLLEITGEPDAGKTMLLNFIFQCFGLTNHEGFNASISSGVGSRRKLQQFSNLPISFIEGENTDKRKDYDLQLLLAAFNASAGGAIGQMDGGRTNNTTDMRFNAGIMITQNTKINGTPALLSRIVRLHYDKSHHSDEAFDMAERIKAMTTKELSGFLYKALTIPDFLESFHAHYKMIREDFKLRLKGLGIKIDGRLILTHCQMAAGLKMLQLIIPEFKDELASSITDILFDMMIDRKETVLQESEIMQEFWYYFDWITRTDKDSDGFLIGSVNHAKNPDKIGINIVQFLAVASKFWRNAPTPTVLANAFKTSTTHEYIGNRSMRSKIDPSLGSPKTHTFLRIIKKTDENEDVTDM